MRKFGEMLRTLYSKTPELRKADYSINYLGWATVKYYMLPLQLDVSLITNLQLYAMHGVTKLIIIVLQVLDGQWCLLLLHNWQQLLQLWRPHCCSEEGCRSKWTAISVCPGTKFSIKLIMCLAKWHTISTLQLDSWWYYKGPGDGVKNWTALPTVFPNGIDAVVKETGWRMFAHNRWWWVKHW